MLVVSKSRKKSPKAQNQKPTFIRGRSLGLDRSEIVDAVVRSKNLAHAASKAIPVIKEFIRRSKNNERRQRMVFLTGLIFDHYERLLTKSIREEETDFLQDLESELIDFVEEITKFEPRKDTLAVVSLIETAADFVMNTYPGSRKKPLKPF